MIDTNEQPMDFETYRIFALYSDGMPVAEIADQFGWASPGTVYDRLNAFPKEYQEAKRHLAHKRNAKYRRVGALALDIQLDTLEHYHHQLHSEDTSESDRQEIRERIKEISTIGESAERRADLNEGKATEIHENRDVPMSIEDLKNYVKQVQDAGTGLDTKSISA